MIALLAGLFISGLEELNLITPSPEGKTDPTYEFVGEAVSLVIILAFCTFWYGWFNKNKGGSPGKLLCRMKVINTKTGENLSYGQTFIRDVLFKFGFLFAFSKIIAMFAGQDIAQRLGGLYYFIIVIFIAVRKDKKGLHDILCNTQVLRKPKN